MFCVCMYDANSPSFSNAAAAPSTFVLHSRFLCVNTFLLKKLRIPFFCYHPFHFPVEASTSFDKKSKAINAVSPLNTSSSNASPALMTGMLLLYDIGFFYTSILFLKHILFLSSFFVCSVSL